MLNSLFKFLGNLLVLLSAFFGCGFISNLIILGGSGLTDLQIGMLVSAVGLLIAGLFLKLSPDYFETQKKVREEEEKEQREEEILRKWKNRFPR